MAQNIFLASDVKQHKEQQNWQFVIFAAKRWRALHPA